jgi:hypothetical protein
LNGIISFSNVPMRLVLAGGFFIAALSVLATVFLFIFSLVHYREFAPPGIPLLTMMLAFFSGIFLFVLGFIGEYIVAIHSQVHQARPDVMAAAHAHSMYGKAWASLGRLLDPITQDACAFYEDHGLFDDYTGVVYETSEGDRIANSANPRS